MEGAIETATKMVVAAEIAIEMEAVFEIKRAVTETERETAVGGMRLGHVTTLAAVAMETKIMIVTTAVCLIFMIAVGVEGSLHLIDGAGALCIQAAPRTGIVSCALSIYIIFSIVLCPLDSFFVWSRLPDAREGFYIILSGWEEDQLHVVSGVVILLFVYSRNI